MIGQWVALCPRCDFWVVLPEAPNDEAAEIAVRRKLLTHCGHTNGLWEENAPVVRFIALQGTKKLR